jgi:hypothetical protein
MSKTQVNRSIEPANTQAILIGACEFEDQKLLSLPAVENNIQALKQLLIHPNIVGIPEDNINTKCVNARVDAEILPELVTTVKNALETLIIYYAGHGVIGKDKNLYLATKNTIHATPELSSALAFGKIWQAATDKRISGVKHILFILDCCYSGRALEEFSLVGNKNVFILTATNAVKKARAPVGATYTAFTGELVSLLSHGINNGRNTLALGEIYAHLKTRLVANNFPEPQAIYSPSIDALDIGYNLIGQSVVSLPNNQAEISTQSAVQTPIQEEQVLELLERLSITQFKKVLLLYKVPKSEIPPAGTQGEQTIALFEYAYQKEGEQFTNLLNLIYKVVPHLRRGDV